MTKQYKMVKFRTSSWNKLRKAFYGRKKENFSDYIERLAKELIIGYGKSRGLKDDRTTNKILSK
jgi:predicted Zn-dependent protease